MNPHPAAGDQWSCRWQICQVWIARETRAIDCKEKWGDNEGEDCFFLYTTVWSVSLANSIDQCHWHALPLPNPYFKHALTSTLFPISNPCPNLSPSVLGDGRIFSRIVHHRLSPRHLALHHIAGIDHTPVKLPSPTPQSNHPVKSNYPHAISPCIISHTPVKLPSPKPQSNHPVKSNYPHAISPCII